MDMDLIEMWTHMNNLVRGVVVVLTAQALACITVIIDRSLMLRSSKKKSKLFASEAGPVLDSGDTEQILSIAKKHSGSHLANLIAEGAETYLKQTKAGHDGGKAAVFAGRALERKGENLSENLNRGMNILASTGSTAPFIGLLGTVLGILNAFTLIASEGSGGLGTIGAAIGEALIVTGYGLMVAIPAVLFFNWLSGRIANYESGLANAGTEFLDMIESNTPVPVAPAPPIAHTPSKPAPSGRTASVLN